MSAFFSKLHAWWAHLWSHAVQGTLPDVPQANQPVTFPHIVTVVPPAPPLPDTHVTPPVKDQAPAPQIEPTPAFRIPPTPPPEAWPKGVELVDEVNGLVTIDPVRFNNPDCAGQLFCVEPALSAVDAESQAAYTIRSNVAAAISAEGGLGMRIRVWPMVATDDTRKFIPAPVVIGETMDRAPWLDNAWTITGGNWDVVLDKVRNHAWHLPTNTGADPHGHVPGA